MGAGNNKPRSRSSELSPGLSIDCILVSETLKSQSREKAVRARKQENLKEISMCLTLKTNMPLFDCLLIDLEHLLQVGQAGGL